MAIIQQYEQNGLRLGSVQNVMQESLIQENYMSDMIKAYGLDIRYYKMKSFYPEIFKPILDTNHLSIHAYGEEFAQEWEDYVKMIAYIKFESDGIVLNAYGVQPDSTMTMWLNQTDFAIAMAKKLSQWREYKVVGDSEFILDFDDDQDLIKCHKDICMKFNTDLFNGSLQAIVNDHLLNTLLMHDSCSVHDGEYKQLEKPIIIPCKVLEHGKLKIDTGRINPMLYKGDHYDPFEDDLVDAHLHLEVKYILKDKHGCIRIMGSIGGGVIYHDTTVVGKYLEKIGPEVGDLIDIPLTNSETSEVYNQKYEIVHIEQTKAHENFMNPFLRKNIYECNLRAYVASGQEEPNGPSQGQVELQDKLDIVNTAAEDAAKKLSIYEDFEDNVYGGYDKINKRANPSVQRDAKNSTINNFDPPKKTKGLRKSTINLFKFKDMGMTLSLVDDPRNNNSFLKLAPTKKSTKIDPNTNYLDYLRASDDYLTLVNGTQAYMLANKFKMEQMLEDLDDSYCIKPIRLKHEVYAQKGGYADQPFSLVDKDDDNQWDMALQDLIGQNTTPEYKPISENRLTFPYSNTYLEVEYDRVEADQKEHTPEMEVWTCFVVLKGDNDNTHLPICSFIKEK